MTPALPPNYPLPSVRALYVPCVHRGGLSWWDAYSLLRLGRWTWPSGAFSIADMVILPSTLDIDARGSAPRNSSAGGGDGGVVSGGDPRPCVACISDAGEVRVLRLGADGAEDLHRAPVASAGVGGVGMLSVPSPARHQFLLVARYVVHVGLADISRADRACCEMRGYRPSEPSFNYLFDFGWTVE